MADLRIARDLVLPLDIVTQAIAILARKGAGKTYTAKKLVELVIGARIPVVVIDPTGGWWGLRTSADGEKPGLPVVIFGGDHADVPLERGAGKEIADVVLEHAGAYILDLSLFESRAAEQTFVADFLERLYRGKKRETGPLLLVVDEADMFAPQRPGTEQIRSLGALEAIVRRGRIKGLGDLLITQRAAVLNKNVLTQTEVLVVMQTTGPQDRAAIDAWIEGNGTREERDTVLASLASLERGEAWVWSPSFLRVLQRVRILPGTTFDSSRTPEAGEVTVAPRAFAQVDVDRLGARITAAIEKAKADDPRELRKKVAELTRQLASHADDQPVIETREIRVEVPVLNGQVEDLRAAVNGLVDAGQKLVEVATSVGDAAAVIQATGKGIVDELRNAQMIWQARPLDRPVPASRGVPEEGRRVEGRTLQAAGSPPTPRGAPRPQVEHRRPAGGEGLTTSVAGDRPLKAPERAILVALAQYPHGRTQQQLSLLSGYSSTSGSFFGALASLKRDGLIEGTAAQFRATSAGVEALGGSWEPLPTGRELVDYWLARLKPPERAVLGALIEVWPDSLTQAEVAERSGYSGTSGSFFGALAKLRKLDLIVGGAPALRASDDIAEHS